MLMMERTIDSPSQAPETHGTEDTGPSGGKETDSELSSESGTGSDIEGDHYHNSIEGSDFGGNGPEVDYGESGSTGGDSQSNQENQSHETPPRQEEHTSRPERKVPKAQGIYLIGAAISFIIFIKTSRSYTRWPSEFEDRVVMQLKISTLAHLLFATGKIILRINEDSDADTSTLAFYLLVAHYARLTHYVWPLAMTLHLLGTFRMTTTMLMVISALGWCLPLIPINFLLFWDEQKHFYDLDGVTGIALYLIPGVIVTVVNLGLLLVVIYQFCTSTHYALTTDRHKCFSQIKSLMLLIVYGIPTAIEMANYDIKLTVTYNCLYSILDSIQLLVLYLLIDVLDKMRRGEASWETYRPQSEFSRWSTRSQSRFEMTRVSDNSYAEYSEYVEGEDVDNRPFAN